MNVINCSLVFRSKFRSEPKEHISSNKNHSQIMFLSDFKTESHNYFDAVKGKWNNAFCSASKNESQSSHAVQMLKMSSTHLQTFQ